MLKPKQITIHIKNMKAIKTKTQSMLSLAAISILIATGCTKEHGSNSGNGIYNGHEYVDLGLPSGTLWATCNVGANTISDYGNYFAWGETTTKTTYNWTTYKYCIGDPQNLTKYCTRSSSGNNGFTDNLTIMQSMDDAATAQWGNGWGTPTKMQWEELKDNTTVTWTTHGGVNGRRFTASNGNSLFLPASGRYWENELYTVDSFGDYWSSSLDTNYPGNAWYFGFNSSDYQSKKSIRSNGHSVRPVRSESIE